MTYAATSPISSSERRPPNAGMAFLPFVTWVTTDDSLRPPAKYLSSASLRRVFSAAMTLLPPAWHLRVDGVLVAGTSPWAQP